MKNGFKAVFFDAGNTLLLPHPSVEEVCVEVLAGHGYHPSTADLQRGLDRAERYYEERYWSDDTFWASETEAAAMWSEMYALVMEEVGVESFPAVGRQLYDEFGRGDRWALYPDVLPTMHELHAMGMRMGIVSNWDARLPGLCHHLGLSRYLDFVISSANLGRIKPEASIFYSALSRVDVAPHEAVHVGDHYYADVLGARAAGVYPVLLDRGEWSSNPDCTVITTLLDLPELVLSGSILP
ncbi:MAG: HAD-IA family hydrolase [Actinobacteria bacterium]|nr:HAD-IA family hydrolase [Actinomycetota bacterium]